MHFWYCSKLNLISSKYFQLKRLSGALSVIWKTIAMTCCVKQIDERIIDLVTFVYQFIDSLNNFSLYSQPQSSRWFIYFFFFCILHFKISSCSTWCANLSDTFWALHYFNIFYSYSKYSFNVRWDADLRSNWSWHKFNNKRTFRNWNRATLLLKVKLPLVLFSNKKKST